jgi:hypothetical protein
MNILDLKRKLLPMSGFYSGGGSSPTSTTTSGMPEWALPYAQDTLAKQSALSEVPYQPYGGDRIQGFTGMQETARQNAAGMGTSDITGQVAQGGLNNQTFGADQASQYMNPYMQNVVDIQKREAQRQSGIQGTQQQAQATQSGAFGGSRDAIMRAERERNLGTQMNDIQAVGSNAAYTNAQNQFNADQNRRLQGLQVAGTAAGQQFQQGMDVNKLQSAYGAQEQAMGQEGLNQAYQDFQNQKAYPQQQLSNMASMMRGLPIGSTQTITGTPGSPSNLQMLGGLGQIGYGLSRFFADGGEVSSYADGGDVNSDSVDSQGNIENIVRKLSDPQLAEAEKLAKARGDQEELQAISTEKAARASMKYGVAAAPVNMDMMLPTAESHARGGIVSFGLGGSAYGDEDEGEDEARNYMTNTGGDDESGGDDDQLQGAGGIKSLLAGQQNSIEGLQNLRVRTPKTAEERAADIKEYKRQLMEGVDTTDRDSIRADIQRMQGENDTNLKHGKGLAFLQSGAAMLEGNDFGRAANRSASTFAQAYGGAIQANQAKNNALLSMKQNLAESQRKEQMGLNKEAILYQDQARKDENAADKFEVDRLRALGILQGNAARAIVAARPPVAKPLAPPKFAEQLAEAEVKLAKDPNNKELQTTVKGLRNAGSVIQQRNITSSGVQDFGATRAELVGSGQDTQKTHFANTDAAAEIKKLPLNAEYRRATPERKAEMERQVKTEAFAAYGLTPPGAAKVAAPAPTKPLPASQIPAGTTFGKAVPGKGTEVLKDGKVIGYAN